MKKGVYCYECDEPLLVPPEDFPVTEFWPAPEHFWHLLDAVRVVHTAATGHTQTITEGMSFTGGFDTWPAEYRPQGWIEVPLPTDEDSQ